MKRGLAHRRPKTRKPQRERIVLPVGAVKTARPLKPTVIELLRRTPSQFTAVRRHIVAHGTLPKGLRAAVIAGQFRNELTGYGAL